MKTTEILNKANISSDEDIFHDFVKNIKLFYKDNEININDYSIAELIDLMDEESLLCDMDGNPYLTEEYYKKNIDENSNNNNDDTDNIKENFICINKQAMIALLEYKKRI